MSSHAEEFDDRHGKDRSPGDDAAENGDSAEGLVGYLVGLLFAVIITGVSFFIASTNLVWAPSIPIAICVLAVAQMGVHLVFFLHINVGPDSANNVLALAFGILIVFLVVGGSLFIMTHMNHNMMPMDQIMQMQR